MRVWIIGSLGLALIAAGCGETRQQRAATGGLGGGVAGAAVGGPVGALAGAGIGAAAGAYRDQIDNRTDEAVDEAAQEIRGEPETSETRMSETDAQDTRFTRSFAESDLTNDEVRNAQQALRDMDLYNGEVDGLYGRRTIQAVRDFQSQNQMPTTGALDERTQQELQTAQANIDQTQQQSGTGAQGSQGAGGTQEPARTQDAPRPAGQSDQPDRE